jgi:hypothetical protein
MMGKKSPGKRKMICRIILFILFLLFPMNVFPQSAPEGIGGLKWEDSTLKFRELTDPSPDNLFNENKDGDRTGTRSLKKIGEIRTDGFAMYSFFKDRFYSFMVKIDQRDFNILKEALLSKYGKPKKEGIWLLENKVVIRWNEEKGSLIYIYGPIYKELLDARKSLSEKSKDAL